MGHTTHRAIVVTADETDCGKARKAAQKLKLLCTSIADTHLNSVCSFLVAPSGSKSGWPDAEHHDRACEGFKEWLRSQRFDDGSSCYEWVEVQYGSDDWGEGLPGAELTDFEWKKHSLKDD